MKQSPRLVLRIALFILSLLVAGCSNGAFYGALGNKVTVTALTISPTAVTIPTNGSVTFTASGGFPPYSYSIVSGFGSVTAAGVFQATASLGTTIVAVKDRQGSTSQATITVTSTAGPLALNPGSVSLNAGGTITFIASGGTPPYTFSIQTPYGSAPPNPSINSSGLYTAGSTIGMDTIKVTDSATPTPATATATVNVTAAVTAVDYKISSQTLPVSGIGGTALPGGYSFTIQNTGTANGSQQISWWVFLSSSPTPGSGTILLESGTTSALAAGASTPVALSWTWPAVPPVLPGQTRYLYIMIAAADDMTTGNNTYAGPALTVAPPDVDYTVSSVSSTGGTEAGTAISGSFTLQNSGSANGSQNVAWTAYVSTDSTATIDAGAQVVDSGSTTPAGLPKAVPFGGIWPSAAGTYYLKVAVSSGDDVDTSNNVQVSAGYATTNVDYSVTSVNNTGALVAGAALGGNFSMTNIGSADGSKTVLWEVYASTTGSITGATLVSSGTTTPLNAGQSTASPITFTGTWPAAAGTWYLVVRVSAADDPTTANNVLASGSLTVNPAHVYYTVTSVNYTGGTPMPTGAVNGNLQFSNTGTNNGTQYVTWKVYASLNTTLDASDPLVASGTYPPVAKGSSSSVISFSNGTWPLTYGNYYLIATVTVPVDINDNPNPALATSTTTPVGIIAEVEDNSLTNLTNANNLNVTFQPGMSIYITGTMANSDTWDNFRFNTGTASAMTFSWNWNANGSPDMYVLNGPLSSIVGVGITNAKSLSLSWSPIAPADVGQDRWIGLYNAAGQNLTNYTLVITAY